jgi:hypothetical protein
MPTYPFDPYRRAKSYIENMKLSGAFDIPVFEVASVMPRGDGIDIFDEGDSFSGLYENEHSVACTTAVASAHVPSSIVKEDFITKASRAFSHPSKLAPRAVAAKTMPPQTIVWWAFKNSSGIDKSSDFIELANLNSRSRDELYAHIATNIHNSVKFIESLKGSSVLWGSWGHATAEECEATGGSRGIPTNKIGHTHVVHFDEALDQLRPTHLRATYAEKLDYIDPWTHILMADFAEEIASALTQSIRLHIKESSSIRISVQGKVKPDANSHIKNLDGFIVTMDKEVRYEKVLEVLVCIAKTLETYYQHYRSLNEQYQLSRDDANAQDQIKRTLIEELDSHMVAKDKAPAFAEMILHITPGAALGTTAQADNDEDILRTLPLAVHASAFYLIENYRLTGKVMYVKSFKIFPEFSSTKAAPERMLGGIQRRQLGK